MIRTTVMERSILINLSDRILLKPIFILFTVLGPTVDGIMLNMRDLAVANLVKISPVIS